MHFFESTEQIIQKQKMKMASRSRCHDSNHRHSHHHRHHHKKKKKKSAFIPPTTIIEMRQDNNNGDGVSYLAEVGEEGLGDRRDGEEDRDDQDHYLPIALTTDRDFDGTEEHSESTNVVRNGAEAVDIPPNDLCRSADDSEQPTDPDVDQEPNDDLKVNDENNNNADPQQDNEEGGGGGQEVVYEKPKMDKRREKGGRMNGFLLSPTMFFTEQQQQMTRTERRKELKRKLKKHKKMKDIPTITAKAIPTKQDVQKNNKNRKKKRVTAASGKSVTRFNKKRSAVTTRQKRQQVKVKRVKAVSKPPISQKITIPIATKKMKAIPPPSSEIVDNAESTSQQQHQREESLLAQQQESIDDHGYIPQDKTDKVDTGINEPTTAATTETVEGEEKDVEVAAVAVAAASSEPEELLLTTTRDGERVNFAAKIATNAKLAWSEFLETTMVLMENPIATKSFDTLDESLTETTIDDDGETLEETDDDDNGDHELEDFGVNDEDSDQDDDNDGEVYPRANTQAYELSSIEIFAADTDTSDVIMVVNETEDPQGNGQSQDWLEEKLSLHSKPEVDEKVILKSASTGLANIAPKRQLSILEGGLSFLYAPDNSTTARIDIDIYPDNLFAFAVQKLRKSTSLVALELRRSSSKRSEKDVHELFDAVCILPRLRQLRVFGFDCTQSAEGDDDTSAVCNILQKVPKLETLHLGVRIGKIPAIFLESIGKWLPELKVLYLHLHESCELSKLFVNGTSLEELYIVNSTYDSANGSQGTGANEDERDDDSIITNDGSHAGDSIAQDIEKKIEVYNTSHVLALLSALASAKKLRVLDLGRHIDLTHNCVQILASGLSKTSIQQLSFSYEPNDVSIKDQSTLNTQLYQSLRNAFATNSTLKTVRNHSWERVYVDNKCLAQLKTLPVRDVPTKEHLQFCNEAPAERVLEKGSLQDGIWGKFEKIVKHAGCSPTYFD